MEGSTNFKVYKSSAGSGKTYTLVKEYLKIVLANPLKIQEVLAITFTNAAAAQMKGRIIKELGGISTLNPAIPVEALENDLLEKILFEIRKEQDPNVDLRTLIENSKKVLERILHNYSDFSVSTIDSFVHRIIRSFAFDLKVPVNFEVESDAGRLLSQAIDLVVGKIGSDQKLTEFLVTFVSRQAEEEKSLGVERMIGNLAKTLMAEDSEDYLEKLQKITFEDFITIQKELARKIKEFEASLRQFASEATKIINSAGILPESFYQGTKGLYSHLDRLSKGDFSKIQPNGYVIETIYQDKWYAGKADNHQKGAIDGVKGDLKHRTEEIFKFVEENRSHYQLVNAVSANIFPLGVLNEVNRALQEIKKENSLLHFSDFNKKISKIVAEQPVPFIYERVGERYKHYMIDEFQDTSTLQWLNLLPLVDNGLAGGNRSLIVGDGKQAIYRWRGGEVEQFVNLPNLPDEIKAGAKKLWQNTLQRNFGPEFLNKNWRSREMIVEFNNNFFDFAKQNLEETIQNIFDNTRQEPAKKGSGGFVQVRFLNDQDYSNETISSVIETVRKLQAEGHHLSDIAILCRSNKNGSLVAKNLMLNKIPVISPDSLLLNQSEEVVFIISLLKLLANKNDVVAACEAITFLAGERKTLKSENLHEMLEKEGLFPVFSSKNNSNWQQVITNILKKNGVDFDLETLRHLSVYDATEEIARTFFTEREPSPFVNFLVDHLLEYIDKGNRGITDFLDWWANSSQNFSVVTPEGVDAVRVMSIHKSKGLEFPVVIFPFATASSGRLTKDGFWATPKGCIELEAIPAAYLNHSSKYLEGSAFFEKYTKERTHTMLDNINLFYVAMTRAEEKLFVFSKMPKSEKNVTIQSLLKDFLESSNQFTKTEIEGEYAFGKTWNKESRAPKNDKEQLALQKFFSRRWTDALRVASNQELSGGATYDKRQRGMLFHSAMEKVEVLEDLPQVLDSLVGQGLLDGSKAKEWEQNLRGVISCGDISSCFSAGATIKNEPGLFDEEGNFFRPDRVVIFENKTVVIDYKSGQENDYHKNQVDNYATILEKMGYKNIRKYLLYLDEPKLVTW